MASKSHPCVASECMKLAIQAGMTSEEEINQCIKDESIDNKKVEASEEKVVENDPLDLLYGETIEGRKEKIKSILNALQILHDECMYRDACDHIAVANHLYRSTSWRGFEDERVKALAYITEMKIDQAAYRRSRRRAFIETSLQIAAASVVSYVAYYTTEAVVKLGFKYAKQWIQGK